MTTHSYTFFPMMKTYKIYCLSHSQMYNTRLNYSYICLFVSFAHSSLTCFALLFDLLALLMYCKLIWPICYLSPNLYSVFHHTEYLKVFYLLGFMPFFCPSSSYDCKNVCLICALTNFSQYISDFFFWYGTQYCLPGVV